MDPKYTARLQQLRAARLQELRQQRRLAAAPDPRGRGWRKLENPTRWMWTDRASNVSFTVFEKQGPGIPIYTLHVLTDHGMFKHTRPSQWKSPEGAFKAAAFWFPPLAGEDYVGVDMTRDWSRVASGNKTAAPRYRDYIRRYKGKGSPMSKEDWEAKVLGKKPEAEKAEKAEKPKAEKPKAEKAEKPKADSGAKKYEKYEKQRRLFDEASTDLSQLADGSGGVIGIIEGRAEQGGGKWDEIGQYGKSMIQKSNINDQDKRRVDELYTQYNDLRKKVLEEGPAPALTPLPDRSKMKTYGDLYDIRDVLNAAADAMKEKFWDLKEPEKEPKAEKAEKPKAEKPEAEKPKAEKPKSYKKKYPAKATAIMDKHSMTDDDADQVKKWKKAKPVVGEKISDAEKLRRFLAKAKPETRERLKGMSPAEFVKLLAVLTDDEGEGGGKQASRIASLLAETPIDFSW